MDRKDFLIRQAQSMIAARDETMDYQSKVLRDQFLAFFGRFLTADQLALTVAYSLKKETVTQHGGRTS